MSFPRYPAYKDSGVEWLGQVPEKWNVKPLKHLADFINGEAFKPTEWAPEGTPIIRIQNLNGGEDFNFFDGEVDPRYHVQRGDLLFGWSGNRGTSFGPFVWPREGLHFLNQHIFKVEPKDCDARWFYWCLKAVTFYVEQQAHGIIGMVHVTKGALGRIAVPLPQRTEQEAVAEFLDRETGKIDAVVEKQETLLKQLEEKRAATISHAVTKGLDPNVPMKDSGVEWLGKVPEHWTVQRLKFLADGVTVGVVVQPSQYYADTGVPALRSLNLRPMGFDMTTLVYFDEASHETLSKSELREGDVVAVRTGKPGVAAPVTKAVAGSNCIDLILIRNAGGFDARFIAYVINSEVGKQQVALGSGGAIQQHFNIEEAANLLLASPDVKEQKLVADHLDRVTAKLDTLAAKARQNIALLRERRAALISAAVTGRIDVRGTAKASTEVGRAA